VSIKRGRLHLKMVAFHYPLFRGDVVKEGKRNEGWGGGREFGRTEKGFLPQKNGRRSTNISLFRRNGDINGEKEKKLHPKSQ